MLLFNDAIAVGMENTGSGSIDESWPFFPFWTFGSSSGHDTRQQAARSAVPSPRMGQSDSMGSCSSLGEIRSVVGPDGVTRTLIALETGGIGEQASNDDEGILAVHPQTTMGDEGNTKHNFFANLISSVVGSMTGILATPKRLSVEENMDATMSRPVVEEGGASPLQDQAAHRFSDIPVEAMQSDAVGKIWSGLDGEIQFSIQQSQSAGTSKYVVDVASPDAPRSSFSSSEPLALHVVCTRSTGHTGSHTATALAGEDVSQANAKAKLRECGCGNILMDDSKFCGQCGKQLEEASVEARVCLCGNHLTDDSKFCRSCGREWHEATQDRKAAPGPSSQHLDWREAEAAEIDCMRRKVQNKAGAVHTEIEFNPKAPVAFSSRRQGSRLDPTASNSLRHQESETTRSALKRDHASEGSIVHLSSEKRHVKFEGDDSDRIIRLLEQRRGQFDSDDSDSD